MSTTASGTTFTLRTPAHIKSCHLTGTWDKYTKRYQMNADKSAGPGWWTLTLKFGSSLPPQRYWYYYILDGYFESHDPNKPTTIEPTRKITLNILDHNISQSVSPMSTPSSTHSSRFGSPSSSTGTSPTSSTYSKRSGGVYSTPESPYYYTKPHPTLPTGTRRTPSPRRQHAELHHIVHPKPRNPMAAHKLTLDTNYRPHSMITTAATTAGDSPSSSRSSSSTGSFCSECSGSTCSSPTTPMCMCEHSDDRRHWCASPDEDYPEEVVHMDRRRYTMFEEYEKDDDLSYRMQRGLRI
jgi:hypothetical protein